MPDECNDARLHAFGVALEAIGRLTRLLEQGIKESCDLSISEFEALLRVERSGGRMPMGELASQVTLTSGGITRLVDRLTGLGYMDRRRCDEDRRRQWATITEAGREILLGAIGSHLDDIDREYTGRMAEAELEIVTEVMDRLRTPIEPA